jgi:Flp pilus assembly protein TadG
MRIQLSLSHREDGAVAVLVAFFAVILLVLAAFTTDFGMAYAQRQALATGADSAALAVIHAEYASQLATPTRTCADAVTQDAALASTIALAQVNANAPFNATIAASDITVPILSCVSAGTVLQAKVVVNRTMTPILGQMAGASAMNLTRQATAALGVIKGVPNVLPIALCINQAQDIMDHKVGAQEVPLNKVWPSATSQCGTDGAGNWGWLDLGYGVTPGDLADYVNGLHPYTLTPPVPPMNGASGDKGNANAVAAAMQTIMDKNVLLPVYSTVTGTGGNAVYTIVGFIAVQICGYMSNNKQALGLCYDSTTPGVQLTGTDMQLRYSSYIPVGEIGEVCALGSSCAENAYITKLLS